MANVPIWVFITANVLLLFLIVAVAIFVWDLKQGLENERLENAKLTDQIRELNIKLKDAIGKMDFFRQEAIKIGNDYLIFVQQTKQNVDKIAGVVNHFENENKRLERKVAELTAELASKTQVIEQLRQRVVSRTGPLGGVERNEQL